MPGTEAHSGRVLSRRGGSSSSQAAGEDPRTAPPARGASAIWHDVECGAYAADLELWEELGAERGRRVLELGCGTGRVGIWLARRGQRVTGLDRDPLLVEEFNCRAEGLVAEARVGNADGFSLEGGFDLALAPMQLVQLLDGAAARRGCLESAARHLRSGGVLALAIVDGLPDGHAGEAAPPLPDVREVDGWVYSSLPLETAIDGEGIVVRRLRQAVSPDGDLSEEVNEIELRSLTAEDLESEGSAVGLRPAGRREIAATEAHVGSTVVLLEREGS
ncbi:MAG TPA: class I SAM-dependent methyltransferase [Solirubrobacterales bacterium]